MSLEELLARYRELGAVRLYAKRLAANNNSKQQIYLGSGFDAVNVIPNKGIKLNSEPKTPNYKAAISFYWLHSSGRVNPAPGAQLILYPDYPEVRLSGFLKGAVDAPNDLLRIPPPDNRVLFLGILRDESVIGHVLVSSASLPWIDDPAWPKDGVLNEVPILQSSTRTNRDELIRELRRIHELGWIHSKQLGSDGTISDCVAQNCGGYTLEAELGIAKNSANQADYLGYEVKQHAEKSFDKLTSHAITLLVPEPTGGFYFENKLNAFLRKYGYPDQKGKPDRLNFGGVYKVGVRNKLTRQTLVLRGYDSAKGTFEATGELALTDEHNEDAATWSFIKLLEMWRKKHGKAAYVPSQKADGPERKYRYGHTVRIGEQTDFIRFLAALNSGEVYYDPAQKLEGVSIVAASQKARSMFRINSKNLAVLYERFETVRLIDG